MKKSSPSQSTGVNPSFPSTGTVKPETSEIPSAQAFDRTISPTDSNQTLESHLSRVETLAAERQVTTLAATAKSDSLPLLNLEKVSTIINFRFQELCNAMKQSDLYASDQTKESIISALNDAKVSGNIRELNKLWKNAFNKVVNNPDNPSSKALLDRLSECKDRKEVLKKLESGINSVNLQNDQELRDLFLIDLTAHLMTIGLYIEIFAQSEVIDQTRVEDLYKALEKHDKTKVFEQDGKTVNKGNLEGYMLLPLIFGTVGKNSAIKDHKVFIPAEVKGDNPLSKTRIAAPILSHVRSESHHPEYHLAKKQVMSDIDIDEFAVDGLAAGSRPDRFKPDTTFSETLPKSLSFWSKRLDNEKDWGSLPNAEEVKTRVEACTNKLRARYGNVKLEEYLGLPLG